MSLIPYSISATPLGLSIWHFSAVDAPAQFIPELTHSTAQNKIGTNTNVDIRIVAPIVSLVDGISVSQNKFILGFTFNALRSVKEDALRARVLDEFIDYLQANKANIVNGSARPVVAP